MTSVHYTTLDVKSDQAECIKHRCNKFKNLFSLSDNKFLKKYIHCKLSVLTVKIFCFD